MNRRPDYRTVAVAIRAALVVATTAGAVWWWTR